MIYQIPLPPIGTLPQRYVFFSFDFDDVWRAENVRNCMSVTTESRGFIDKAEREKVRLGGDRAIAAWIDEQMQGTSVTIVCIGAKTSCSRWVKYEIGQSNLYDKGLLGIHIHNIADQYQNTSSKGQVPPGMARAKIYDWKLNDGRKNILSWIAQAASAVRR